MLGLNLSLAGLFPLSQQSRALAILRRPGITAHAYIAGASGAAVSGLLTNNYTLSDGSTGYSAVDGSAGLVLDGMGSLGAVIKGAASPLSGTTGFAGGQAALSMVGNEILITQTSGIYGQCSVSPALVPEIGKMYKVTGTFRRGTHSSVQLQVQRGFAGGYATIATSGSLTNTSNVTKELYFTATATDCLINVTAVGSAGDTSYVESFTVQEYTGIHATQPTTLSKPSVRRGLLNLLTYSNDFSNAAWTLGGSASKTGTNQINFTASTLDKVTHTTPTSTSSAGMVWTQAMILSGSGTIRLNLYDDGGAYPGTVSSSIALTATPTIYTVTRTHADATATKMAAQIFNYSGTVASVVCDGALLTPGTLTAQQILDAGGIPTTTTAAASNPSAGRYWLGFDGVNDYLTLGSVPFQMADDHAVVVAFRCDSFAGTPYIWSSSNSSTSTCRVATLYILSVGVITAAWRDDAGVNYALTGPTLVAGTSYVVSARRVGGNVFLRVNGVQVATTAISPGASTNNTAAIGAFQGASISNYFVGAISELLPLKGTFSDTETLTIERLAASTLPNAPSF